MRLETYFVFSSPVARLPELKGHQAGAYFQSQPGNQGFDGVWIFLRDSKENSLLLVLVLLQICAVCMVCWIYLHSCDF